MPRWLTWRLPAAINATANGRSNVCDGLPRANPAPPRYANSPQPTNRKVIQFKFHCPTERIVFVSTGSEKS